MMAYQCHVLVDRDQRRILDSILQQSHEHVEGVEGERSVDPRIRILGVVTDRDGEGYIAEHTGINFSIGHTSGISVYSLAEEEELVEVVTYRPQR